MARRAVAKKEETPLADVSMFEEYAGAGFENADDQSFAIPLITILQKMSPQLDESEGAYIEGAKPGQFLNTATGELYDEIDVVACYYTRRFVHWQDREEGGGYLGEYTPDDPKVAQAERNDRGRFMFEDGTYLLDTRHHYILLVKPDGSFEPAVIPLTSTQIKASKQWMTRMNNLKMERKDGSKFTPPTFAKIYHATSVVQSNAQGSWRGWKFGEARDVTRDLLEAAKGFRDQIVRGDVKVTPPSGDVTEHGDDSDVPF